MVQDESSAPPPTHTHTTPTHTHTNPAPRSRAWLALALVIARDRSRARSRARAHRDNMQAGPADDEEFDALPVVPLGDKKLRACLVTGLVKTEDQARRRPGRCAG